jgi:adenosylhomocysteine nucleosidase
VILLVTATPWEAGPIEHRMPRRTGRSGREVALLRSGIGETSAERALDGCAGAESAALIVSCGFAGAVHPDLATGDLVADSRALESEMVEALRESAASAGLRLAFGHVGHADRVLTATDKRRLASGPAARWAVVDMETAAVRRWAESRGVPCLALRAVLDGLDDELPGEWPDGPGAKAAAAYMLSHLGSAGLLLRTWRKSAKASESLARGIEAFLEAI